MSTVRVVRSTRGPSVAELDRRRAFLNFLWERHLAGRREALVSLNLPWRTETKS
jgi:hypothetical protein